MVTASNPFQPAIDALEKDAAELERQWVALVTTINVLRDKAGLPPRGAAKLTLDRDAGRAAGESQSVRISHDTFFGKRMGTAAREFLEMRKAAGEGPAKPRQVFEALKAGGFQFETKDENIALVSLRAIMRKNTATFVRLPNGTYGLASWYPNAKRRRSVSASDPSGSLVDTDDSLPGEAAEDEEAGDASGSA